MGEDRGSTYLPAARPTSGALEAPTGEFPVVNWTCGTVTAVLIIEVVDEDGIGDPDDGPVEYVTGTTVAVEIEITVSG